MSTGHRTFNIHYRNSCKNQQGDETNKISKRKRRETNKNKNKTRHEKKYSFDCNGNRNVQL